MFQDRYSCFHGTQRMREVSIRQANYNQMQEVLWYRKQRVVLRQVTWKDREILGKAFHKKGHLSWELKHQRVWAKQRETVVKRVPERLSHHSSEDYYHHHHQPPKCGHRCREVRSLRHCWWECTMVPSLWKRVWTFLKKWSNSISAYIPPKTGS